MASVGGEVARNNRHDSGLDDWKRIREKRSEYDADQILSVNRRPDVLVLALPRGGVPVASEVARALEVPMDVFVVRKLGVPGHEELAMGSASGMRTFRRRPMKKCALCSPRLPNLPDPPPHD